MYEIIDNFLPEKDFVEIVNTLFPKNIKNTDNFCWYYQKGIVRDPESGPTGYEENDWLYVHPLYDCTNGLKFDRHYYIIKPILNKLKVKKLFDIRANLLVPTEVQISHLFHVDRIAPHQVALYYVTNCNGYTILKDTAKIDCVGNRLLLFDGIIEHHSVSSTYFPRCTINFNFN